jgi:hypothetical protein
MIESLRSHISEQDDRITSLLKVASTENEDPEWQLAQANEDYQRLQADSEARLSRDLKYHKAKADECQRLADELEASQRHVAQLEEQLFKLQSQLAREQENHLRFIQSFNDSETLPPPGSSQPSLAPAELKDIREENERPESSVTGPVEPEGVVEELPSQNATELAPSEVPVRTRALNPLEKCQRLRTEDLLLTAPAEEEEEEEEDPNEQNGDDSPSNDQDLF